MNRSKIGIIWGVILSATVALFLLACPGSTPPIRDQKGHIIPDSVASLERIEIGGMEQWILMRGQDSSNPVLLWLHGGPGAAQMPVACYFNGELEKDFVVVHWDQRGAGKSNRRDFDESTLTFQQFIEDGHELTLYLKARFNQEKIYLVGHSWGTQVGIKLAQAYPQDYYAYVGVSQVVDPAASQQVSHAWLLEQIKNRGNQEDLKRLEALGSPPYTDHEEYVKYINLVDSYGGDFDVGMTKLVWMGLRAPEYNLSDMLAWFRGANRGSGPMWEEPAYQSYNAMKDVPQLRVPVYFFNGRNDYTTPLQVTQRYFERLDAPMGKHLVVFDQSAHTPLMGEPEKFNQELVGVKKETYGKDNCSTEWIDLPGE